MLDTRLSLGKRMENAVAKNSRRRYALHQRETTWFESNQISPFCAFAIPLTVDCTQPRICEMGREFCLQRPW
jgi:hypothetical protein